MVGRMLLGVVVFGIGVSVSWAGDEVATVNGKPISRAEFEAAVEAVPPAMREQVSTQDGRVALLDDLITQEVLLQEGRRTSIEKDPLVKRQLEMMRRQILIQAVIEHIVETDLTDERVKAYYESHPDEFRQVRAGHILLATEDEALAAKVRVEAGDDFSEVAKELSTDPSAAENGGDLGFFRRGQMVEPFGERAFALKLNEVSDPVKTEFGFHIIKVLEVKEAEPIEALDQRELSGLTRGLVAKRVEELKSKAKIVKRTDRLE